MPFAMPTSLRAERWIVEFLPVPPFDLFQRSTGIFIPTAVVPEDMSSLIRHPSEMRDCFGQSAELPFAFFHLSTPATMPVTSVT